MADPTTVPYSVHLDPGTARNLAVYGATILLLDVPPDTPIGVDQQVFLSGPNFKGIKMIPPGTHFLSYQLRAKDGTLGLPVSTFLHLDPRQVVVRRWSAAEEGLVAMVDADEEGRYAAGVSRFDFDQQLGPYDLNSYSQWCALSCHISEKVLQELLPADGEISIMAEATDPSLMTPNSKAERALQQQLEEGRAKLEALMHIDHCAEQQQQQQQQQVVKRGGRCHYTHLPRLLKVPGAPAEQLTALNMDKTSLLEQVLTRYDSGSGSGQQQQWPTASRGRPSQQQQRVVQQHPVGIEVIGELQFAFIAFVCAQSLEGYMQWKQLLVLMLGCIRGPLQTHCKLFEAFLSSVTAQLQLGLGHSQPGHSTAGPSSSSSNSSQHQPSVASNDAADMSVGSAILGLGLVDELLPDSFLKAAFRGFFKVLQELPEQAPAALLAQASVLESVLASGLGWDFRLTNLRMDSDDDTDDEDRPVVVELTADQLAALGGAAQ